MGTLHTAGSGVSLGTPLAGATSVLTAATKSLFFRAIPASGEKAPWGKTMTGSWRRPLLSNREVIRDLAVLSFLSSTPADCVANSPPVWSQPCTHTDNLPLFW